MGIYSFSGQTYFTLCSCSYLHFTFFSVCLYTLTAMVRPSVCLYTLQWYVLLLVCTHYRCSGQIQGIRSTPTNFSRGNSPTQSTPTQYYNILYLLHYNFTRKFTLACFGTSIFQPPPTHWRVHPPELLDFDHCRYGTTFCLFAHTKGQICKNMSELKILIYYFEFINKIWQDNFFCTFQFMSQNL